MGEPTDCGYQLRRIGPPKSLEDVQDIMRLSYGCSRFGRSYLNGGPNEFFLDSSKMKNFISRRHAEIYVKKGGECVLVDLGLNGTYVNDVRVDGKCALHLEDRVTFGHIRGMSIKPGAFAPEPDSEFQFIFERSKPCSQTIDTEEEDSLCKIELKFEQPEDIPGQSECNVDDSFVYRRDSYDKQVPLCEQGNQTASPTAFWGTPVENRAVKNTLCQPASSTRTCAEDSVIVLEISDDSDSENDDRPKSQSLGPNKRNDSGHPSCESDTGQQAYVVLTSSHDLAPADPHVRTQDTNLLGGSMPVISQEEEQDRSDSPVIPNMSYRSESPILQGNQGIAGRCKIKLTFPEEGHLQGSTCSTSSSVPGDAGFVSGSASEDDDLSLDLRHQKMHKQNCQRRGRRKKRFKRSTDHEDEVQWYEVATCASLDCKKPNSSKIGWVQCDSCDQWYHTSCVGCTYNQVRDKDIEFHCGCV